MSSRCRHCASRRLTHLDTSTSRCRDRLDHRRISRHHISRTSIAAITTAPSANNGRRNTRSAATTTTTTSSATAASAERPTFHARATTMSASASRASGGADTYHDTAQRASPHCHTITTHGRGTKVPAIPWIVCIAWGVTFASRPDARRGGAAPRHPECVMGSNTVYGGGLTSPTRKSVIRTPLGVPSYYLPLPLSSPSTGEPWRWVTTV